MPRTRDGSGPQVEPATASVGVMGETTGMSRPEEITVERILAAGEAATPAMAPPGVQAAMVAAPAEAVTGTWTTVTVDATWSIQETRNAFLHVAGGAWKKIFNGTDGAFMLLTLLAAQAKQTGKQIAMREEADGLVHEIYLW